MNTSPTKRRALAALDPNASPKPRLDFNNNKKVRPGSPLKKSLTIANTTESTAPTRASLSSSAEQEARKRPLDEMMETRDGESQPAKKACVESPLVDKEDIKAEPERRTEDEYPRPTRHQRSTSPDASSVFDASVVDTSQATNITEPDAVPVLLPGPRMPVRPRLTREQAREKAEILRLRLGLASYKLRTGQTDVPLERLQIRPLPGSLMAATNRGSGTSNSNHNTTSSSSSLSSAVAGPPVFASSSFASTSSQEGVGAHNKALRRPLPSSRRSSQEDVSVRHGSAAPARKQSSSNFRGRPAGRDYEDESSSSEDIDCGLAAGTAKHGSGSRRRMLPERSGLLPRLPRPGPSQNPGRNAGLAVDTPQRRRLTEEEDAERLTSSALRGGAANGLLSLSMSRG